MRNRANQQRRRRRLPESERRRLYREFVDSGLTVRAFCQERGISSSSLNRWRQEYGGEGARSTLQLVQLPTVEVAPRPAAEPVYELELAGGHRLRLRSGFDVEEVAALVSHFRTETGSKQVQIIDHTVSTQVMMTLSFAGKLSPMPGIEEERARMQALWNEEDERMRFSIQGAANAEGQAFALSPLGKRYFTTVILNLTGMVNQRIDEIATQRPDRIQLHGDSVLPFVEGFKRESA